MVDLMQCGFGSLDLRISQGATSSAFHFCLRQLCTWGCPRPRCREAVDDVLEFGWVWALACHAYPLRTVQFGHNPCAFHINSCILIHFNTCHIISCYPAASDTPPSCQVVKNFIHSAFMCLHCLSFPPHLSMICQWQVSRVTLLWSHQHFNIGHDSPLAIAILQEIQQLGKAWHNAHDATHHTFVTFVAFVLKPGSFNVLRGILLRWYWFWDTMLIKCNFLPWLKTLPNHQSSDSNLRATQGLSALQPCWWWCHWEL